MAESCFAQTVDIAGMAEAFGIHTETVTSPGEVDGPFLKKLFEARRPVIVDCRLADGIIGPGYERYNRVRSLIGKGPLTEDEMGDMLLASDAEC